MFQEQGLKRENVETSFSHTFQLHIELGRVRNGQRLYASWHFRRRDKVINGEKSKTKGQQAQNEIETGIERFTKLKSYY